MEYYNKLADLGCFSANDVISLTGNENFACEILRNYEDNGLVERVRDSLYVALDLKTKCPVATRFTIGSHITEKSYITHHSAFEYYASYNQVCYEVYVAADKPFSDFEYDDITYKYVAPKINSGVIYDGKLNVRTTDAERTIIDGIDRFDEIGGLEELLKCLEDMIAPNETKLLKYLAEYNSPFLYQKAGYIMESLREPINFYKFDACSGLSDDFFEECHNNIGSEKCRLSGYANWSEVVFNEKWNLYAPKDLIFPLRKGVPADYGF